MEPTVLFAGMAVRDFPAATDWYGRFFGRPADVVAHETEVLWKVTDDGWFYVLGGAEPAGGGIAAVAIRDLDAVTAGLASRGIEVGPIEPAGDAGRKTVVHDPEGNSITIIEVAGAR